MYEEMNDDQLLALYQQLYKKEQGKTFGLDERTLRLNDPDNPLLKVLEECRKRGLL